MEYLDIASALAKPFGPDQLYVAPPVAVKLSVAPTQTGALLVITGFGKVITVTLATAVLVQPAALVTVTVYAPLMFNWALAITGFC